MSDREGDHADPARFHERLDDVEEKLEAAETETDLDDVEADLTAIEEDLESATFDVPEPEDDEEEPEDPAEEIEDRIDDIADGIEDQRGPYAEDVLSEIDDAVRTITNTEWAEEGIGELSETVNAFTADIETVLTFEDSQEEVSTVEEYQTTLEAIRDTVDEADLDPDEDADTITALLEATDDLGAAVEAATAFSDLEVREQLNRRGFFDVLGHYKDFPPEWSALKAHEEAGNVEMILLAFDLLDSNYMEEHCVEALRRLGDEKALEPMMNLARRRDHGAIEVLGKIGSEEPLDMLVDYAGSDGDPMLQTVSLRAIGEIGSAEATHDVAQQLVADDPRVRSAAARSLGMIGDPRAIAPLTERLEDDTEDPVRGSAAWALVQIGTDEALSTVAAFTDDPSHLVATEARKPGDIISA